LNVVERTDSAWKSLFRIGGIAALIIGVFYTIEIIGVATTGVPPSTVTAWFALLQNNNPLGFFDLFFLDIGAVTFSALMFLALYFALRRINQTYALIATALAFVSIADYFATNTALSMLSLSNQYAAAATDAQRSILLMLGQQLLAVNGSTGAFMANTLNCVAGIIISVVMLRSHVFGRLVACVGILANALEVLPFVPADYVALVIGIGGVFLVIWYYLIALKLIKLGRVSLELYGN
jgi:hypothetical protein